LGLTTETGRAARPPLWLFLWFLLAMDKAGVTLGRFSRGQRAHRSQAKWARDVADELSPAGVWRPHRDEAESK